MEAGDSCRKLLETHLGTPGGVLGTEPHSVAHVPSGHITQTVPVLTPHHIGPSLGR